MRRLRRPPPDGVGLLQAPSGGAATEGDLHSVPPHRSPSPSPRRLLQRWGLVSVVGIPALVDRVTVLLTELRKETRCGRERGWPPPGGPSREGCLGQDCVNVARLHGSLRDDALPAFPCLSLTNLLSVVVHLFRWIPFAMLSARQEDTVTDSQPVRCTVRRASV